MADIKQVAIIIGIAVLFSAFIIASAETFYETPKYENYCNSSNYGPITKVLPPGAVIPNNCADVYSTTEAIKCSNENGMVEIKYNSNNCPVYDNCNYCNKYLMDAQKKHGQTTFIILAILGVLTIIFGVYFKIEFIGSGFMYGGIIILFYATVRFLMDQNKYIRILILFIELLIVILIGYKKLYKKK